MRYFASIPLYHLSKLNATTMLIGSCFAAPRAVFCSLLWVLTNFSLVLNYDTRLQAFTLASLTAWCLERSIVDVDLSAILLCSSKSHFFGLDNMFKKTQKLSLKKWDQEGWLACFAISLRVFWWHQNKFQTWPNQDLLMVSWVKPFVSISFQNLTWQQRYCPSLDTCWSTALGQVFTWWPLSCFQPFSGNHGRQIHLNVCVWWGTCFVFRCAV